MANSNVMPRACGIVKYAVVATLVTEIRGLYADLELLNVETVQT